MRPLRFPRNATSLTAGILLSATLWPAGAATDAPPLFDAHLHYSAPHAEAFEPAEIIARLKRNNIERAVFMSTPNDGTEALYALDPERIVPFAGLYRDADAKQNWHRDDSVPERLREALASGIYQGIGELHLFAWNRDSPVFHEVVDIAAEHGLVLMVHGDPTIIDTVFERAPMLEVIWAHAGSLPYPALIADYLERYPTLHIDTSVRDGRIAPDGELDEDWRALFKAYPDRFMVGVDTFSSNRWRDFDQVVTTIRSWLTRLPPDLQRRLRYENAATLFEE
ncbi:MAG: amidohydrolase family protein [Pseudomonadota bacterium]